MNTNDAIQGLVDFYTEQAGTNNFDNFLVDMSEISDTMENDLRVWWSNDGDHEEEEVEAEEEEIPAEIVEKQITTNVYTGEECINPDFFLGSLMLSLEDRFHFSDYSTDWNTAKEACAELGFGFASVHD